MTNPQARLLVTYDGSEASEAVFEPAARIARRMQGGVVLLRVHQAPRELWVHPDAAHREAELARLKAEWQAELAVVAARYSSEADIPVEAVTRMLGQRWSVTGEILAVAEDFDVDMICMATHGESSIRHFFVGSTALEVLSQSKRPVTLIRVE